MQKEDLVCTLAYDADTGEFVWGRVSSRNTRKTKPPGTTHKDGYKYVKIGGKSYAMHRLAWLITYGNWPKGALDHINGDRTDNRISNLREASPRLNSVNRPINRKGRLPGCWFSKCINKWCASLYWEGNRFFLGTFDSEKEAHHSYISAVKEWTGENLTFNSRN